MRIAIATSLFILTTFLSFAQKASFLYIQGDKKTPFYVKFDGQMQPRYGKNYCIMPELPAGVANIEILFQQNAFPAQKFAVKIPDGGERGFLIVEKSGDISLYDIEQEFYLAPGNSLDEDHLPPLRTAAQTAVAILPASKPQTVPATTPRREPPVRETRQPRTRATAEPRERTKPAIVQTPPPASSSEPRFIPNLSLDTAAARRAGTSSAATGCGAAMDVQSFAAVYRKALDIGEQDDRLLFLNKQTGCFSPTQLRLLARVLDRDAARFTFLKKIQPRITVAARFAELEDLLASEAYRTRFRELLAQ